MIRRALSPRKLPIALALAALLGLLVATPLVAQPGHGRGHGPGHGADHGDRSSDEAGFGHHGMAGRHLARLAEVLDLTEAQKQSAQEIHDAAQARVEPIRTAQKERHQALRALLDSEAPDAAEVGQLVIAQHDARAQVKAVHEAAMEDFRALLTAEQLEKLEALHERRGERRDKRGKRWHGGGDGGDGDGGEDGGGES